MVVIQIDTARHFEGAPQRLMVTVHPPTPLDVHQVRAFNATFYRQRALGSTWQAMHLLSARLAVVTQSSGTFLQPGGQFSVLCTDGSAAMATAANEPRVQHEAVNLSISERVHIQNANVYHGRLKVWLARFKGVATAHLESYLDWFRALDRASKGRVKTAPMLELAVALAVGIDPHH